ncbi:putative ribonuclease H-like domain-containing protein [Tanacetum coccineum]|uniref:Ribonuclease H-like domain-containing protein n=1 Tax=Tanacetum coccineum TaxID=301880 RepID=A0ABQ4Z202_9ASTR
MDDLYNNLKVYESEIKGQTSSSSNSQNVAFVSCDNSSSTNETVNTTHSISDTSSKDQASNASYIDADDLEEMDLKWQVAMLTMIVKRATRNQGNRNKDAPIRNSLVDTSTTNALVVQDEISSSSSDSELEEALKEKDDLKLKLEKFEESSKNLTKLINSQISAKDKTGLGYDGQMNESEVVHSVFNSRESDVDDNPVNDRFKIGEGFHVVPPPYTGNYMPLRPDLSFAGLDESVFKSAVRKTTTSVPETKTSISKTSKDIIEKPKTVRPSAPIIEEWDTDNDNDSVFRPKSDQTKPKNEKPVLNNKGRVTGQREIRPVWNNAQRVNHQNKLTHPHPKRNFVPTAVATKSGQVPVNAAKQSSPRAAASISTARPVNTVAPKPKVNDALPTTYSYFQAHSPVKKPINKRTAVTDINFNKKINTAKVNNVTTAGPKAVVSAAEGNGENVVKSSACWIWRPTGNVIDHISKDSGSYMLKRFDYGNPQYTLQDQGIFDSGCSRHMTGNKSFLTDYQEIDGGFVAFGGSPKGGKITGKGKIRTGKLDFEDVYFVKELKFNLFSVSQMCDKKNSVLFTETECLILSPDFKLLDESQVLRKVPRHNNMYSFDLKNVVPSGGLTCLFAKATIDESNLWHRRLGHINFKTMNKLVRGNLVRGLSSKLFENDHTCVACQKGKQHKASCKTKTMSSICKLLQLLHMDLFGPVSIRSINKKTYCLVVTDDFSIFSWVFFLATKDETSGILKTFITGIENQINHKVKIIICDNGTEFKNNDMNQFCGMKGIKREFSVSRTPQQNGVAERKNRTLIEAAKTMLADSFLPTTFSAEAVNTACYIQNRVFLTQPHNKTPYELLHGRPPSISFIRHVGGPVIILNTLDPLGKFDGKANVGFLVGYSINSKAFRVFNTRTRKVKENMHITFLENKPNVTGSGPDCLFDIDLLTNSMNYEPDTAGNQTNRNAVSNNAGKKLLKNQQMRVKEMVKRRKGELQIKKEAYANNTNRVSTVSAAGESFINADDLLIDPLILDLEDTTDLLNTGIFNGAYDDEDMGGEANLNNLEITMNVSPIPTIRIHKDHPKDQIIRDINLATQTILKNMLWIEAIRLFLAYATFMGFIVYQMDVKSDFLYGTIEEEVYVCQTPGFEDPQFPDKVYKVEKALYGLHKAPRAWYETLSTYLLDNGFRRGTIDKNLFIKKDTDDAQEIPDELYRGAYFLLRVAASTPMEPNKALIKDAEDEDVDVQLYRSMIGSLMYLTGSRPNIMFAVYACARFQVTPKVSHLHVVKRIFRYLKGQPKLGLWYPRDLPFDLEAFSNSDYAGASLDRKSITGGYQFLGKRLISWQCKKQTIVANSSTEAEYVVAANCGGQATGKSKTVNDVKQIHATVDDKTMVISESSVRINLHFNDEDGITCLSNDEIFVNLALMGIALAEPFNEVYVTPKVGDEAVYTREVYKVVRSTTTATSLEAEQESGNIHKTRSMETLNEPSIQGTGLGSGPRCQDSTLGDVDAQTRFKTASKQSRNPPLSEVNITGRGRTGSCLGNIKDCSRFGDQKVKKESQKIRKEAKGKNYRDETLQDWSMFKEGDFDDDFEDIDDMVNEEIENVEGDIVNAGGPVNSATTRVSAASASVTTAGISISTAKPRTPPTTTTTAFEDEDLTTAQTLVKMRSEKAKEKGVAFKDTLKSLQRTQEKAQIQMDEELAMRLREEEKVELEKMQRERAAQEEASNAALIAEFDDVQARMDAYALLAARLQEEERD